MRKIFCVFLTLFLFFSCAHKMPLNINFYNDKKVAVVMIVDSISRIKSGSQGKLDKTLSSGAKYKQALKLIGKKTYPKKTFLEITHRKLTEKKKPFVFVEEDFDLKSFPLFPKKDTVNKIKFYTKDLRPLKAKYNVDQLMLIKIKYGLSLNYYSMIETSKGGLTSIDVNIINLDDNSVMYKDLIKVYQVFTGKWNDAPHYKQLHENINQTLATAFEYYEAKF